MDVYALAADVDMLDGVPVGRLVFKFRFRARDCIEPKRVWEHLEWKYLEPHRRYWLGLDKPKLVRIEWYSDRLSYQVFHWRRTRVSWSDRTRLAVAGIVHDDELLLEAA